MAHYVDLVENNYNTPGIRGVDGNAYGSAVTALITYRTPFSVSGQPVKLTFGLVEGLCARSIIGITTMQKAKMNYLVHSQVVTSEAFNFTFPVTMQKPSTDDFPQSPYMATRLCSKHNTNRHETRRAVVRQVTSGTNRLDRKSLYELNCE